MLAAGLVELSPEESNHAIASLRLGVGDSVRLFDGVGLEADATIESGDRRRLRARASQPASFPFDQQVRVTLAVPMPKTHRQGYLIEKCTELGAFAIWPMTTARSVVRPSQGAIQKWRRRAVEAVKQCGRRWVPDVEGPFTLLECLDRSRSFDCTLIAHTGQHAVGLAQLFQDRPELGSVLVLVGPEGGWDRTEVAAAREAGATQVRLGAATLRVETACAAVCAAIGVICSGSAVSDA